MSSNRIGMTIAVLGAAAGAAQAGPSDACRLALERLHQQEERQRVARRDGDGPRGVGPALAAARRQAAKICLGGMPDPAPPPFRFQAPLSVAPLVGPGSAFLPTRPEPILPRSVPDPTLRPPLVTITHCDSAGCWSSDGSYLIRSGVNLFGPAGQCTSQAGILSCR